MLGQGLFINVPVNRIPSAENSTWLEIYQTTTAAPSGSTQAYILINNLPQACTADVLVDDISLLVARGIGSTGTTGDTGATGVTRVTGNTGATGTVSSASGYIYHTGSQTVPAGGNVTFSSTGHLSGRISFTTPSTITVANGGEYQFLFEILPQFTGGNTEAAYAVVVNGVVQPSTIYGQSGDSNQNYNLVGSANIIIPNGATLNLRNEGSTSDKLHTTADRVTIISASFSLFRLS